MYGAVAATEVVYYASKSLAVDGNAMHYQHKQQAPRRFGAIQPSSRVLLLWLLENREETESDERRRDSMVRSVVCLWLAARGFALSQRQATGKVSTGIFPAFRLLPRLEEVHMRRVHSHASRHASQNSGLPTRKKHRNT